MTLVVCEGCFVCPTPYSIKVQTARAAHHQVHVTMQHHYDKRESAVLRCSKTGCAMNHLTYTPRLYGAAR
jgi:hypothetical protein